MDSFGWAGLGLVAALGGAGVAIFGKLGLEGVDPTLATTLRSVVMTLVLVAVSGAMGVFRGPALGDVGGKAWMFILLAGLSGAGSWLAYFAALRIGAAGQVASIDRLSLVFVMLFAGLFLGERYGWRGWSGVGLVVVGILLIAGDRAPPVDQSPGAAASSPSTHLVAPRPSPRPRSEPPQGGLGTPPGVT